MSHKPLFRLKFLEEGNAQTLLKNGVRTCGDLLQCSTADIMAMMPSLNRLEAMEVLEKCAQELAPPARTANTLWEEWQTKPHAIRTQIPLLDGALHDGIPLGSITELCGPAGLGKTQFALSLSVITLTDNFDSSVVYIDTEGKVSANRVKEIAERRFRAIYDASVEENAEENLSKMLKRLYVWTTDNTSSFESFLNDLDTRIVNEDIKLIVIDSIAALVRGVRVLWAHNCKPQLALHLFFFLPLTIDRHSRTAIRTLYNDRSNWLDRPPHSSN
eukprot:gb/GECG01001441.1/.p1 GENE.gb/GECG01001441.1/~~gb/GECG01001441.1/.p1  ORF type:complete len:273 (+),score=22.28 gb/GECG01001441.1/:1-819(+)